jgi:hypothetical protein
MHNGLMHIKIINYAIAFKVNVSLIGILALNVELFRSYFSIRYWTMQLRYITLN